MWRRRRSQTDFEDEIRAHIDLETDRLIGAGMNPADARRAAQRTFGNVGAAQDRFHDATTRLWIEHLVQDVRYALRVLRRTPVLAAAAIITIALGIGANAAIFSAVYAVVFRPLPFPHPDRLVMVTEENSERNWHLQFASEANYLDWRDAAPAFEHLAAYDYSLFGLTLTGRGDARRLLASEVTGNFFATLGVRAERGRTLEDDETWDTSPTTAVLSHAAWEREFGADPSIIGKSITLDGTPYRVVGIMPKSFAFPWENVDLWVSFHWSAEVRTKELYRRVRWVSVIGRLAPNATFAIAESQLARVAARLELEYPSTNAHASIGMTPLHEFLNGDTTRPLVLLLSAVSILLLIACANVANLMLVHAAGRQREIALRLAIGAGRGRVVRQAITESLLISLIGGLGGLVVAWAGTRALSALQPSGLLRVSTFGVDRSVLVYVFAITVAAGVLFGVAPALWARERDPAEVLKGGSRSGTTAHGVRRWGNALVVAEVALALLLTAGAGLLARSLWNVAHVDVGFDSHGVLVAGVNANNFVSDNEYFVNELMARAHRIPGVTEVAWAGVAPLGGQYAVGTEFTIRGHRANAPGSEVPHFSVSPEYFSLLRIPLRRGRPFTAHDRMGSPPVALINETFAKQYFPGEDPIGQAICFTRESRSSCIWNSIVGVVADQHESSLELAPRPSVYWSTLQHRLTAGVMLVRTTGDVSQLATSFRGIVRALEPRMVVTTRLLDEARDKALARPRFFATLLFAFAFVGLVLSIVGVYGVLAYVVKNRTHEMGIRIALGAQTMDVQWLVVSHGLRLVVAGIVAGSVVALFATRAMTALLFGVAPTDPPTLIVVSLVLGATSLVASWIPAARAGRADPVSVLRAD